MNVRYAVYAYRSVRIDNPRGYYLMYIEDNANDAIMRGENIWADPLQNMGNDGAYIIRITNGAESIPQFVYETT